jgi:hypothetical protein
MGVRELVKFDDDVRSEHTILTSLGEYGAGQNGFTRRLANENFDLVCTSRTPEPNPPWAKLEKGGATPRPPYLLLLEFPILILR